jgi:two-component system phosphate regulon sensor histidine kinase PhoR
MAGDPFSLFSQIQEQQPLNPIEVNSTTLTDFIASLVDLLIEQQLAATLWVKLPPHHSWLPELRRYLQQVVVPSPIYLCCSDNTITSPQRSGQSHTRLIPVPLTPAAYNSTECFLIVRSSQWCSLILADKIASSLSRVHAQYKLLCSFDPDLVKGVLRTLNAQIVTQQPATVLTELKTSVSTTTNHQSVAQLLLKQLQKNEINRTTSFSPDFLDQTLKEFGTPLTHIKTALRLLESKKLKAPQRQRYVEMLQRECDRQNSLITGLQKLINLEQYDGQAVTTATELADLIPSTVSTYQPLAQEKGIRVGYTIPAQLPAVYCSSYWLREILVQLLTNSLNAIVGEGRINVLVTVHPNALELLVQDTGVGITPPDLPKAFLSFYRKPPIPHAETGAGLGLTLVQTLLERCGGSISIASQPEQGTQVKVLLAIVQPPPKTQL